MKPPGQESGDEREFVPPPEPGPLVEGGLSADPEISGKPSPDDGITDGRWGYDADNLSVHPAYEPRWIESAYVLISVLLFDFFLYSALGGTGYGLLVALWAAGFWLIEPARRRESLPIYLMAVALGLRNIWQTGFLLGLLPFLCLAIGVMMQRGRVAHWLDGLVVAANNLPLLGVPALGAHLRNARRFVSSGGGARHLAGWIVPILGALLVLLIFGGIFVTANPVVERIWEQLKEFLSLERLWREFLDLIIPSPWRAILWIAAAILTAGFLAPSDPSRGAKLDEDQRAGSDADRAELTGRTSFLALSAAGLLFSAYILVDLNYLLIRAELPPGISDSDYARRGALWLTFALGLSTFCIGLATAQSQLASRWIRPVTALAQIWAGLDLLTGLCVLGRIGFYIDVSGLTPLRIAGVFGTLTVLAGVTLMILKIALRKNLVWLIRRYVAVFLVGVTIFALLPRDTVCSLYNVSRVEAGDIRPLILLFRAPFPPETLPEYCALLDHPDPVVAAGMASYLAERRSALSREPLGAGAANWRRFQAARFRAEDALDGVGARLRADPAALAALARACGGYDEARGAVSEAWRTGQSSDLEWLDD
jgi:hypothetical protein